MSLLRSLATGCVLLVSISHSTAYKWPARTDHLESIYYQQGGLFGLSFASEVLTCGFDANFALEGRINSAEWIRAAYHDMATADVQAGTGGLDASIAFELDRDENRGSAFLTALNHFTSFTSNHTSLADIIALGAVVSVTSCTVGYDGWLEMMPLRGGRVDATGPGPSGVPEPHQDLATHTATFAKQGFSPTEMIQLVACGHTVGGVHGKDFPEIVPEMNDEENKDSVQAFDNTKVVFDNHVRVPYSLAKQFLENSTQNPLAFGLNETTRSDFRIFSSDGGVTIRKMADDNHGFLKTCLTLFDRMLNTVPANVQLSETIGPIPVKPDHVNIAINANGTMTINVDLRILDPLPTHKVLVHLKSRAGSPYAPVGATLSGDVWGSNRPFTPSFQWYHFTATVPAEQGISGFIVELQDSTGNVTVFDNGGDSYPLVSEIIPQTALSCMDDFVIDWPNFLNVTVAILDSAQLSDIQLVVPYPSKLNHHVLSYQAHSVLMEKIGSIQGSGYSLYHAVFNGNMDFVPTLSYDIRAFSSSGVIESVFNIWKAIPTNCHHNPIFD